MKRQDKDTLTRYLNNLEMIRMSSNVRAYETEAEQSAEIEFCKGDVVRCINRYFPHYATSPSAGFQIKFAGKVLDDRTIKAFAEWGRGLAKSVWCDVILPFWLWTNDEAHYMVLVGQTEDRAKQLLGDLQAEFEANPQIIKDFGEQKLEGSWEIGKFRTRGSKKRGLRPMIGRARGLGQEVRGLRIGSQRPDLCVVDDIETREIGRNPKRQDQYVKWIEGDLIPTMDGPIRRLLYANNKFADRMIQTILQKKHANWHISHVPAYYPITLLPVWDEKYPDDYYIQLEKEIGLIALEEEYGQKPHKEGKIFKPHHMDFDKMPNLNHLKIIIGHWDIAYTDNEKSDFNAVRIWGLDKNNKFWFWQGFVRQCKMKDAVAYMCDVQLRLPDTVIVHWQYEAQFWNDEVERTINEVQKEKRVNLYLRQVITPKVKKYDRILEMYVYYQNNRIKHNQATENDNDSIRGREQLFDIEPGYTTKDDSPDADREAIRELEKHTSIDTEGDDVGFRTGKMEHKHERL
ncbi:MAG: hypothetical protein IE931_03390 [Sphingobacteriales bacterium]|nr:hypothetical protein [Sphingobacteriales bacterium]